jgi:hypothetical protein
MADHRIRLEKPLTLSATTPDDVARAFQIALRLNDDLREPLLLHMALLCLTAHRGSSITRTQLRDVFTVRRGTAIDAITTIAPTPALAQPQQSAPSQTQQLLSQLSRQLLSQVPSSDQKALSESPMHHTAIIFRDTKTATTIGNYALHLQLSPQIFALLTSTAQKACSSISVPIWRAKVSHRKNVPNTPPVSRNAQGHPPPNGVPMWRSTERHPTLLQTHRHQAAPLVPSSGPIPQRRGLRHDSSLRSTLLTDADIDVDIQSLGTTPQRESHSVPIRSPTYWALTTFAPGLHSHKRSSLAAHKAAVRLTRLQQPNTVCYEQALHLQVRDPWDPTKTATLTPADLHSRAALHPLDLALLMDMGSTIPRGNQIVSELRLLFDTISTLADTAVANANTFNPTISRPDAIHIARRLVADGIAETAPIENLAPGLLSVTAERSPLSLGYVSSLTLSGRTRHSTWNPTTERSAPGDSNQSK